MPRSAVFIDAGYLIKMCHIKQKKLNFLKLSDELTIGTERVKTIFYDTLPIPNSPKGIRLLAKTQKFHSRIRKLDKFEIRLGRQQKIKGEFIQKGVDMRLGVDLVQMSMNKNIEKAVIITADSDFEYAIEKAQEAGTVVSLAYFPGSKINLQLLQKVSERVLLDDALLERCKL